MTAAEAPEAQIDDAILKVRGVTKGFGGLEVLKGIDLDIPTGSITGLIGPNGSGKSTLFDLMTGYLAPDSGQVLFHGEDLVGDLPHVIARKGLIRTFQLTKVFRNMTVADNLLVFADSRRSGPTASQNRALDLLEFVHLSGLAEAEASTLSYGQSKLLEFAQVLMHEPSMLLLDEPFAGINPGLIEQLLEQLKTLQGQGVTILLVEHNLPLVTRICDSVAVLSEGIVAIHDEPPTVVADPRVKEVFLGE